jgi:hypothetical protein
VSSGSGGIVRWFTRVEEGVGTYGVEGVVEVELNNRHAGTADGRVVLDEVEPASRTSKTELGVRIETRLRRPHDQNLLRLLPPPQGQTYHKRNEGGEDGNISGGEIVRHQEHSGDEMFVQLSQFAKVLGLFKATRSVTQLLASEGHPFLDLYHKSCFNKQPTNKITQGTSKFYLLLVLGSRTKERFRLLGVFNVGSDRLNIGESGKATNRFGRR